MSHDPVYRRLVYERSSEMNVEWKLKKLAKFYSQRFFFVSSFTMQVHDCADLQKSNKRTSVTRHFLV